MISEVIIAAFKTFEISNHTEQFIIDSLRADKSLTVSLVAEMDGRIIGHSAFSPVSIVDGTRNWYVLGPVSVLPEHQRKGIGASLIRAGLSRLKNLNAQDCCLVGHPDYYKNWDLRIYRGLCMKGCHRKSSSHCLSMVISHGAPSLSTRGSKRTGQKNN